VINNVKLRNLHLIKRTGTIKIGASSSFEVLVNTIKHKSKLSLTQIRPVEFLESVLWNKLKVLIHIFDDNKEGNLILRTGFRGLTAF